MAKFMRYSVFFIICILVGAGIWFLINFYEGEIPAIEVSKDLTTIGKNTVFDITCYDQKSGLKKISVTITQNKKTHILDVFDFSQRGVKKETFSIEIDTKALSLKNGPATLQLSAIDYSLRKNQRDIVVKVTIDTKPPQIFPVSSSHYINPGGSCITIYKLSEEIPRTGIQVDDYFFPSYAITRSGTSFYISYFSIPCDVNRKNIRIGIIAEDEAGNSSFSPLPFYIRNKKFRKDNMHISENFLVRKMPEFQMKHEILEGTSLLDSFLYINEEIRQKNFETIQTICKKTEPKKLWKGAFLRMENAATMARFGDKRTYIYNGKEISKSTHMGIDLAATKNAPVGASNTGIVAFTGYLGIYGNSIIIDHGMGLFSLYAHLSSIGVETDQIIEKGNKIGNTGLSGLAGGDHLHFSIIVGGKFVNPQEWWDSHWIKDNIERKLNGSF